MKAAPLTLIPSSGLCELSRVPGLKYARHQTDEPGLRVGPRPLELIPFPAERTQPFLYLGS